MKLKRGRPSPVLALHTRASDPSVSFGLLCALCSISVGGRVVRRGHLYAISVRDLPATVSQRHCGVSRIVKRNSRTQVSFDRADPRPCDVSHLSHAANLNRVRVAEGPPTG